MVDIDVIVPTYYRNDTLATTLDSILSREKVSTNAYVIDMSGEGNAREVADEYGAEFVAIDSYETEDIIEQIAIARDIGVKVSDAEYVSFVDDDDVLVNDGLYELSRALTDECGAVFGIDDALLTEQLVRPFYRQDNPVDREVALGFILTYLTAPFSISSMLVKRNVLEQVSPMGDLPHDDIGPVLELVDSVPIHSVDRTVVRPQKTVHGASTTPDCAMARAAIYEHYEELYGEISNECAPVENPERKARSEHYRCKALAEMRAKRWSASAIKHRFQQVRYDTEKTKTAYLLPILSLLGRPGIKVHQRISFALSLQSGREIE